MVLKQPADGGVGQHSASLFRALAVTAALHRTLLAETLRHVVRVAFELTLKECKYRRCLLISVEFFYYYLFITQPGGSLLLTFFMQ